MLDINVTVKNNAVVIEGLQDIANRMPWAIRRGLERVAVGIYGNAFQWLSGPGAKDSNVPGGGYPVPVRTGHLRQSLDWLAPGQSKTGEAGTFTAGDSEVVIFDSASYAGAIFLGMGSSAGFGPRDALRDALDQFNKGDNIQLVIEEEIRKEIGKR